MIESVINLGIKGSELVASRLRAIQDGKKKIEKKTDVPLNIPKKSDTGTEKPSSNILQRLTGLETVEEKAKRDSEENKKQTGFYRFRHLDFLTWCCNGGNRQGDPGKGA